MKFTDLVTQISRIDGTSRLSAGQTLQQTLSLRNWLIGACIVEFEQAGEDRAAYGQVLIQTLARALTKAGCHGLSASNLKNFRQVALAYPGLEAVDLSCQLSPHTAGLPAAASRQTSPGSGTASQIRQTSGELPGSPFPSLARRATEQHLPWRDAGWVSRLFAALTFSHLLELSRIDDATRRAFYEVHCLKERWSVREFQRQCDSMLYERIGLSENRDAVLALARDEGIISDSPAGQLRDPYVFEFLGIEPRSHKRERSGACARRSSPAFPVRTRPRLLLHRPAIPHHCGQPPLLHRPAALSPAAALPRCHRSQIGEL